MRELYENLLSQRLRAEKATGKVSRLKAAIETRKLIETSGLPVATRKILLKRCEGQSPTDIAMLIETTRQSTRPANDHHHKPPIRNAEKVIQYNTLLHDDAVSVMYTRLSKLR